MYKSSVDHSYLDTDIKDLSHRLIVTNLLTGFGIKPGDTVIEIGPGTGRYTSLLLSFGVKVIAFEPDDYLYSRFQTRLGSSPDVECHQRPIKEISAETFDISLLCGFHVLHHLDKENLLALSDLCNSFAKLSRAFKGWFFLEPNQCNPLYSLQILTTRGMSFSEEKGIWRFDYPELAAAAQGQSCFLGSVGVWPPRRIIQRLPERLQTIATTLKKSTNCYSLYRIYGGYFS